MEKDFADRRALLRQMLVEERNKSGLKQAEVSAKLDKPQSYISKIERGERGIDIVEFFEISDVIGFEPLLFLQEFVNRLSQ